MNEHKNEDFENALRFLKSTGPHAPGTAATAYIEHVTWLIGELKRLEARQERCECPAMFFQDLE